MTSELAGVFIPHEPIRSPRHHMGLALRNGAEAAGAGIYFDGPPCRNVPDVPSPIKGLLMGVIAIQDGSIQFTNRT